MDLLSICIPTYNRKDRLDELLKSIIKCSTSIKIVIVDNGSDDGTYEVVTRYQKKYKNLIYHRNETNLGHDENYRRLIEIGSNISHYSLWLGDDDRLKDDFFRDIPEFIKRTNPDFVLMNSINYQNNNLKRLVRYITRSEGTPYLRINSDLYIDNVKYLFFEYCNKMPFGIMIVKNSLFDLSKCVKYKGTYHLYEGAIWEALCDKYSRSEEGIKAVVLAKVYVIRGKGKKSYTNQMAAVYKGMGKWYAILPEILQELATYTYSSQITASSYGEYTKYICEGYESFKGKGETNRTIS